MSNRNREREEEKRIGIMSRKDRARRLEIEALRCICHELGRIATVLERVYFPVFKIAQLDGGNMSAGTITGTPVGGVSTFGETDPAGFVDPVGAVRLWSTSDTVNTSITPSPNNSTVSVAAAATAPVGGSYILTFTDTDASGNLIGTSGPITVPFLPAVVAPPVDFVVNQLS